MLINFLYYHVVSSVHRIHIVYNEYIYNIYSQLEMFQVQVINEEIKHCWPQYQYQEYSTSDWPPFELCATKCNLSSPAIQFLASLI